MFRVESPTSFAQGVNRDRRRKRLSPWCNSGPRGSSSQHAQREESGKCCEKDDPLPSRLLDPGDSDNLYNCGWKLTRVDVVIFSGWYIFPTRQLAECWDNHASTLAFSNMTCPQKHQITTGLIDTNFLSSMVSEAGQDSPIVLACRAIGHAFLTSKVDTPETRSKRAATYGQALEATNMALEDPIMQTQDETLASVWLLSLYELIVSPGKGHQPLDFSPNTYGIGSWIVHTQGLVSLLRLRGTLHFCRPLARDLFWLIYSSVLVRCFITNMASPSESSSWFRELEKDLTEDELPTHQLCVYGHHASTFCATIRQVIDKWTTGSARAAAEIFAEVEGFERRMQQLWHVTSGNPSVETVEISDSNIRLLCCRTYLHAFRLKLQLTLLELLGKMRTERCDVRAGTLQHEFQLRVETVQSVADEILACVPLLLSTNTASGGSPKLTPRVWRDGVRLLWPLRLVALWSATRDDQKRAAKIILQQIRDEVGIYPAGAFPPSFLADMATK
ncbi:uncharacterized protein Z520_09830 [Fonsecaea multimorphosa CBS 102226]|uniref:Transcription factor domain-containing protein n=1 Tax=Fonsecaea multimorphosa CBS 102226 TaxID=1442371 RepID=A0A0D2JVA8_9EURO|nr:uncharacterized protein Z520_09830 [Fonsecaea multimorphosa CBS 102226]KIX94444.1 hypothetical protein Z520_09830 [Fonsecaea multimorphosa CBS 102226]